MEDETSPAIHRITLSLIALASATTLGLVCGLLLAPQSGMRSRRQLQNMALDAKERMEEWTEDAKSTVDHLVKQGKKVVGGL